MDMERIIKEASIEALADSLGLFRRERQPGKRMPTEIELAKPHQAWEPQPIDQTEQFRKVRAAYSVAAAAAKQYSEHRSPAAWTVSQRRVQGLVNAVKALEPQPAWAEEYLGNLRRVWKVARLRLRTI